MNRSLPIRNARRSRRRFGIAAVLCAIVLTVPLSAEYRSPNPAGKQASPSQPPYELPDTGGGGTLLYTFCGALLTSSAMYGFCVRRKTERREDS